jgi:hypothetical protein
MMSGEPRVEVATAADEPVVCDRTVKLAGDEVVADFDDELDILK